MNFLQICEKLGEHIVSAYIRIKDIKQQLNRTVATAKKKRSKNDLFSFAWSIVYALVSFTTAIFTMSDMHFYSVYMFMPAVAGIVSSFLIVIKKIDIRRLFFHRIILVVLNYVLFVIMFFFVAPFFGGSWLFVFSSIIFIDLISFSAFTNNLYESLVIFLSDPFLYYFLLVAAWHVN